MDKQQVSELLAEYEANIELWKHDDTIRVERNAVFLSVNTLLVIAIATLITISKSVWSAAVIAGLTSAFGLPTCVMWYYVLLRNGEYVRFRRFQLRSIEARLTSISTITNQWKALNEHEAVSFPGIDDEFHIKPSGRQSNTVIESWLPLVIAGFWFVVFVSAIAIGCSYLLALA